MLVPGQLRDEHPHGACVRDASEGEPRADQHDGPRGDTHLALQRHDFARAAINRQPSLRPGHRAALDDAALRVAALLKLLRRLFRATTRAAEEKDGLVFGAAALCGKFRIESVERREMHARDVHFRMFRRGADIEQVELFALLKSVI